MNIRVGFGYDIHRLAEGRSYWLGGVKLEHHTGAVGHSDADVLLHAIADALLGAANLRDIGFHFPDTDPGFKGADSRVLLGKTYGLLKDKGFKVGNLDCTVVLEQPKVNPYIPEMQQVIAGILEVDEDDVSIKATTSEKMSFVGREEGIKAYAVALIQGI